MANANDRDTEALRAHLDIVKGAIEKDVDGVASLFFGGSVSKNTYVAGLSDVDALVAVNQSSLADSKPSDVVEYIAQRLRARLPSTPVDTDGFAITVRFSDGPVQIIPVKREAETYLLPNNACTRWSRVRPKAFTEALTAVNQDCGGKVVPTIKLAKVALADTPERRRPTGHHLEVLAVEVQNYSGPYTLKSMLKLFLAEAASRVLCPIRDRTGQSRHVDESLGAEGSLQRQIVSDNLSRIARRLTNADGMHDLEQWKRTFGVQ